MRLYLEGIEMVDTDQKKDEKPATESSTEVGEEVTSTPEEQRQAEIDNAVKEALKDIKGKLDNSFAARDEALRKVAEFEAKQRAEELRQLEVEGKHKEAYELRLAQVEAEKSQLQQRNTELTRDVELRGKLATLDFKSPRALELAYNEIVSQLVQDKDGKWVHKSGQGIGGFLESYASDEEQAFLFKQRVSTGAGTSGSTPAGNSSNESQSLFKMTQAEVLKRAAAGKLPRRR